MNRLPEVKRFLKEPGHADKYENLKVKFIRGRNPTLYIRDDGGALTEQLDLSGYKTRELHDLLIEKGFSLKSANSLAAESDGESIILPVQAKPKLRGSKHLTVG